MCRGQQACRQQNLFLLSLGIFFHPLVKLRPLEIKLTQERLQHTFIQTMHPCIILQSAGQPGGILIDIGYPQSRRNLQSSAGLRIAGISKHRLDKAGLSTAVHPAQQDTLSPVKLEPEILQHRLSLIPQSEILRHNI